jgi:hypothetical protein
MLAAGLATAMLGLAACGGEAEAPAEAVAGQVPGMTISNARLVLAPVAGNPAAVYFDLDYQGEQGLTIRKADVEGAGMAMMHEYGEWDGKVQMMEALPIALTKVSAPVLANPRRISIAEIFHASPLAVVGAIANGLGQAAFFNLGAVFGVMHGLSLPYVSTMMAVAPMAVLVSQMPIGWLSDRYDRRLLIVALSIVSSVLAGIAMFTPATTEFVLIGIVAVFGGISMPLYSLAIAHANDQLNKDQMLAAGSKLVLLYGAGAIAGPSIAGLFMQQMGSEGFMFYMVVIYGGLAVYAVYRMTQSKVLPPSETGDLVPVAPMATAIAATAVAEEMAETADHDRPAA